MHERDAFLFGHAGEIGRERLSGRLAVIAIVDDAAHALLGSEPHIVLVELPANEDLGRQFEHLHL